MLGERQLCERTSEVAGVSDLRLSRPAKTRALKTRLHVQLLTLSAIYQECSTSTLIPGVHLCLNINIKPEICGAEHKLSQNKSLKQTGSFETGVHSLMMTTTLFNVHHSLKKSSLFKGK